MGDLRIRRGSDEGSARPRTHESSEGYPEAIIAIRAERGFCRNVDIAEHMGVTKPSVAKALGNLMRRDLAEVVDHDVRLIAIGERLVEETLSKHRFFEGRSLTPGRMRRASSAPELADDSSKKITWVS